MFEPSFTDLGIPPEYGFRQLLFNPMANALIVQTTSGRNKWRPERLYFRHVSSDKYTSIGTPDDLVSQEHPVVSPSKPLLAFNCMRHSFLIDAGGTERHGANWDSLKIYDLNTNQEAYSLTSNMLQVPREYKEGWISSILSFEAEQPDLFVVVGLKNREVRYEVRYFVSKLRIQDAALKLICPLPAVFM